MKGGGGIRRVFWFSAKKSSAFASPRAQRDGNVEGHAQLLSESRGDVIGRTTRRADRCRLVVNADVRTRGATRRRAADGKPPPGRTRAALKIVTFSRDKNHEILKRSGGKKEMVEIKSVATFPTAEWIAAGSAGVV